MPAQQLSVVALILCVCLSLSLSNPEDLAALLAFKASSDPSNSLFSWVNSSDPCSATWLGVSCDPATHRVTGLFLQDLNLAGTTQPLSQLAHLRHLSLNRNLLFSSSLPLNLSSWPHLKHLYLSHNHFGGAFPTGISQLHRLRRLDLSHNSFSGEIPLTDLTRLPRLLTLRLESNSFTGDLNSVNPSSSSNSSSSISDFNVSDNNLTGEIPRWLAQFPASSFARNKHLCGKPLPNECSNLTVDSGSRKTDKKMVGKKDLLVLVYIGADAVAALGIIVVVTCCVIKKRNRSGTHMVVNGFGSRRTNGTRGRGKGEEEEMVVFEGCKGVDEVGDLLKASAVLLGNGCMGSTYKVVMDGGDVVAAKMVRGRTKKKEVDGWLRLIGGLRHSNIVSLRAYHHSNHDHELLLVYDFLPNGSLHSLLHGNRGPGRTPLEWSTRIKVASDSAQSLAFLHAYDKANIFHGHLTSSNILVDHLGAACITDIGLRQLFPAATTSSSPDDAYEAPELLLTQRKHFTQKCDVYSFGVILLEILTGKMAVEEGEVSLVKWVVQCVAQDLEESARQVFDFELLVYKEMEVEMMAVLQLALLCVAQLPKDRPKMSVVHRMIEDIRMRGGREVGAKSIFNDLSFDSSPSPSETI